jgi:hypothetical protein
MACRATIVDAARPMLLTRAMSRVVAVAILCTLALGVTLRAMLAGVVSAPAADFSHLRHAHSHLGIYGVLFPAFLVVAREAALGELKRSALRAYALAVVVAVVAFALGGYGPVAIAASAVVLVVWLGTAVVLRPRTTLRFIDMAPVALVIASLLVPVVAASPRNWPELAQPLARTIAPHARFAPTTEGSAMAVALVGGALLVVAVNTLLLHFVRYRSCPTRC